MEHNDVDVEEALAAADGSECMGTEAFMASECWEELVLYVNKAEGRVESIDSEWEWSEDFAVVVDAAVELEAVSGMVGVAITELRAELGSMLQQVQGMEVCNHASMMKVDQRLQELKVVHSAKGSDSAGTATGQLSVQSSINRKGDINREEAGGRDAITVEQTSGADQQALK